MKKRFTILIAALMLLTMMASTGTMWGQSYTISLKDNGTESDASSSMGYSVSSAYVSNYVDVTDNLDYVYTISFNNYVYKAKTNHGWKLSSSSKLGRFVLNLTTTAQALTVSKVTVNAKNYGTDETSLVVTITKTDNTTQNQTFVLTSDFSDYELTLTSVSTIKSIQVETNANSKKRAYVHHITVTCPAAGPTQLDSPTNFTATPGNGEATFTWDAVEHASSYTISYTTDGETWTDIENLDGTSYTKTGLDNDTEYTCKIKAVGDDEDYIDSEYSETITVTPTGATFYTITIDNGIENGSVEASASSATEGTSITLTSAADAGYDFDAWNVYKTGDQTTTVTVNNNAFNMPDYNVTVSATFTPKTKYTIIKVATNGTITTDATNDEAYEGQVVSLTLTPNSGYEFSSLTVVDADEDEVAVTNNHFTMPGKAVTVTATFTLAAEWVETSLAELTTDDIFVIVGNNGSNYAMTNDKGTSNPPVASAVTITNGKLTSTVADNIKWNISGNSTDGYTFYPNGSTTTWLYCTNTNNGVRVGTNDNKTFKLNNGYLKHDGTSRYVGIYSSQDWRCYTSNDGNIDNQTFAFYKRALPAAVETPVISLASGTYNTNQSVTITCATDGAAIYYTLDGTKPTSLSTAYTSAITIDETKTLKAIAIKNNEESYVASATYTMQCVTPTFSIATGTYTSVQSVTITSTAGASIYYTLDGTTPTGSSTAYTTGAITIDETKTLKAIAIKSNWENSEVASASYTIYLPLTTIDEIYASSATSGTYAITFDDWVVSGIQTGNPSKKAYVTDGEKGFAIYNSDGHGLSAGDVLSGTVICSLSRYNGSAQVSNISGTLNHNTGGEVTVANIALAELSGINTGALISYNDLSYDGTNLSDGNTNIKPFGDLTSLSGLFTSGNKYHVKGIYLQYSATKEIMPRSSADVVLAADMTATDFSDLTLFTYVYDENGTTTSAPQYIGIDGTDFAGNLTITVSNDYEISTGEEGSYTNSIVVEEDGGEIAENLYVRLKAGLDAAAHNGTLTFEASNLTTIVKNLEGMVTATQTYDIVINTPIANGSVVADVSVAEAGETVTLTAIPDDCYQFATWVTEPTVTWVSDNQFTMPEKDVLVSATFTQKTFVVTYSFNGDEIWTTSTITCGETTNLLDEDDLTTLGVVIPSGFYFQGWSEDEGSSTLVSSPYTPTATRTLYAVLTYGESEAYYAKVTSDLGTNWAGDYLIAYSSTIFADGRVGGKDNTGAIGKASVKVNLSDDLSGNKISVTAGDTYNVTLEEISENSNTYVLKTKDGKYNYQASNSNGLAVTDNKETAANYPITVTFTSENDIKLCLGGGASGAVFRYNPGTSGNTDTFFRFYKDGGQNAVYLYKRTVSEAPNFNEVVNVDAIQEITTDISENTCVIVENNGVLTFSGENQGTAANLIIEEGGQLILPDDASVQATVKNSTAASTETKTYDIQWNAISSPVDNVVVTSFVKGDTHNVYRYDEKTVYWQEYRGPHGFNNLQNGRGYIYRSTESGIEFQGEVITGTVSCADYLSYACDNNRYIGFNLIGNPFTHDITWSNLTTKTNISSAGFFLLGADGNWSAQTTSGTIAPMQAFLVQATEESPVINISNTAGKGDDRYGNDQIQFTVNNSEYSDVAYAIFREGHGLNKIEHRNDNIPMLYIINDDKDYAIAEMPDNTNVINLGFKARAIGQYTLSLNAEGRYSYMHLYDKLTGSDVDMLLDNSYTFVGSPSDRNDRFVLRLNYNAANIDTESDIFAYQNGADIIISGTGELQIFDIMGHQVSTQRINGVETINVSTQGVYILRLVGTEIKTQKIVVR